MFQYEELGEEVRGALEEVLRAQREAEEQTSGILDAEGLEEAKQLYLIHQVCIVQKWKCGDSNCVQIFDLQKHPSNFIS